MTIYLDVILIENICMNYIILFATAYLLKTKRKQIRLLLSSLLGSIYAVVSYMLMLESYSNIFIKMMLSIAMVYLAYHPSNIKSMLKHLLVFYLTSFALGGCAFALLYVIRPQDILMKNGVLIGTYPLKVAILGGIVGFAFLAITFKVVKGKFSKKNMFCNVTISFKGKKQEVKAMIDTGNLLKDPITGEPVIVVEKEMLTQLLPNPVLENLENMLGGGAAKGNIQALGEEYVTKFRIIPFTSLGKQNGILLGFKPEEIQVNYEENTWNLQHVIIGIYGSPLSKHQEYTALLGLDILERSEENECSTNVKV